IGIDGFREGVVRREGQALGQALFGRKPQAVVIRAGSGLVEVDAAERGDRPKAANSLVVVAVDPQMAALATDVSSLNHGSPHLPLEVEVVAERARALEGWIHGVKRAADAGGRGEGVRYVYVAGVIHGS